MAEGRFGISVGWMMEAAGWQVARFCAAPTTVVCGVGNNAGDGLAAARHLHRWGRLRSVCCMDVHRLRGAAEEELKALRRIGVRISMELDLEGAEIVVDAVFGTGLSRPPEHAFAAWIEAINASGKNVVAVDVPSGLDADTGVAYSPSVRANLTVALGLPKPCHVLADGPELTGEVWIADIGVPFEAYAALGVVVPADLFAAADRVLLNYDR